MYCEEKEWKFKKGDVVRLKSSHTPMVITGVTSSYGEYQCFWFGPMRDEPVSMFFDSDLLEKKEEK